MAKSEEMVLGLSEEVQVVHERLGALDEFLVRVPPEDIHLCWAAREYPEKFDEAALRCMVAIERDQTRMLDELNVEKDQFEQLLEQFQQDVEKCKTLDDYAQQEKVVEEINGLHDAIKEAELQAKNFNEREAIFGQTPTDYPILESFTKELEPFFTLWNMISDFHTSSGEWLNGEFVKLDGANINDLVEEWWKTSFKMSKTLEAEFSGPAGCAAKLRAVSAINQHIYVCIKKKCALRHPPFF